MKLAPSIGLLPAAKRRGLAVLGLLLATAAVFSCKSAPRTEESTQVLMVCEHGSVKSVMAASYFNKAAQQRGLPYRATARGVSPDASVPASIAAKLSAEGFDVSSFEPTKISAEEIGQAMRVIVISLQPQALAGLDTQNAESWLDVPAASTDYAAAKASLVEHIEALLDELAAGKIPLDSRVAH